LTSSKTNHPEQQPDNNNNNNNNNNNDNNRKWFFGFVLIPCLLVPFLLIEGDVQDVKSGRIQRKNTTWY
jgi:hypothetical protein